MSPETTKVLVLQPIGNGSRDITPAFCSDDKLLPIPSRLIGELIASDAKHVSIKYEIGGKEVKVAVLSSQVYMLTNMG